MNQTLRTLAAGATGALVMGAVVLGQPAVADQLDKAAAKNSVTSKSIKNGTIKTKDLSAAVAGSLAKADSALQNIPDNSITNPKLADNAVGSAEVAADSLTAADLAANSVNDSELASDSISGNEIVNGSLNSDDVTARNGVESINLAAIGADACGNFIILSGDSSLAGDLITVTPGNTFPSGLVVEPKPQGADGGNISVVVCNITDAAIDPAPTDYAWATVEN